MLYLEGRDGSRVRRWALTVGSFAIGRGTDCEIVVDDPLLSKRHLQITVELDGAVVQDQDSKNGLWIDGERVSEVRVPIDRWFAAGGTLFAIREGVTLVSDPTPQRTPTDIGVPQITLTRRTQAGSNNLHAADDEHDTGESPLPAWVTSVADTLNRGAATHDQLLRTLLAAAAQTSGTASAAVLRETPDGIVLDALHGPPLPDTPTLDAATLRCAFASAFGCLHDPASDLRFGVIEGTAVDSATYWLVVCPVPKAGVTYSAPLLLLAAWAFREAAQLPRVRHVRRDDRSSTNSLPTRGASPPYVAVAASSQALLLEVQRVALTELPVLIVGDSGTGKELLAKRVHAQSRRADGPFIAVNCAAIPAELLEAELFGIEKGVATGVSARPGRMAQAHGGTLFLDEIGDLPPALQPKLLRALETREITPLGAPAPMQVDLRLVAATHANLRERALSNSYRRDLYFRLAGSTLHVLPLRERPEDILPLARQFAEQIAHDGEHPFTGIDLAAARLLLGHTWPGNVRELKHAIERAVAFSDGPILHAGVLPPEITLAADTSHGDFLLALRREYRHAKLEFERLFFTRLLARCGGDRAEAIQRSGLSRSQFYAKLAELGLNDMRPDDAE